MSQFLDFKPFPFLTEPHAQSVVAAIPTFNRCPPSVTRIVPLPDGDKLACEVSTPSSWRTGMLTVFTIHGLCGSHRSTYQVRLANKLFREGVRVVRINLRGCGSGRGLARLPYHAGCSDDVLTVLRTFHADTAEHHFKLVGYSLGGNVALRLAGELGPEGPQLLDQVISVCPPINLFTSSRLMSEPENWLFRYMFMRWLTAEVRTREAYFPHLTKAHVHWSMSFREFDEVYTAPRVGYRNAIDYYNSASSELLIPRIQIDTKIVFSEDDPIIDCNALDHLRLGEHLRVYKTKKGGHVGFYGHPKQEGGIHWLDAHLLDWLTAETAIEKKHVTASLLQPSQ